MKKEKVSYGNTDEKEKARKLTDAELKRLERFETLTAEMLQKGYRKAELTVSIVKANAFGIVLLIPLIVIGLGLFILANRQLRHGFSMGSFFAVIAVMLLMIVVHELIHGLTWAYFTEHHFKDIEFGFMKQYLTPYCACCTPLTKNQYIIGALMPMIVLGIIPMIIGILAGSLPILLLGIIMTDAASGDILIVWNILRYRSDAASIVYIDHPTQAGGVIFEKDR